MNGVPASFCSNCYPDCNETVYERQIISVPFRNCDVMNYGVSRLCNPSYSLLPQPKLYQDLLTLFKKESYDGYSFPTYFVKSNNMFWYELWQMNNSRKINDQLFGVKQYEANEKDIALVEIYFPNSKAMKLKTQAKMNWVDYLSTVGGLLGLVLGMGFISFVEIFWLCLRIVALKLNFQNIFP